MKNIFYKILTMVITCNQNNLCMSEEQHYQDNVLLYNMAIKELDKDINTLCTNCKKTLDILENEKIQNFTNTCTKFVLTLAEKKEIVDEKIYQQLCLLNANYQKEILHILYKTHKEVEECIQFNCSKKNEEMAEITKEISILIHNLGKKEIDENNKISLIVNKNSTMSNYYVTKFDHIMILNKKKEKLELLLYKIKQELPKIITYAEIKYLNYEHVINKKQSTLETDILTLTNDKLI